MTNLLYFVLIIITSILLHESEPIKCWYCGSDSGLEGNFTCRERLNTSAKNAKDYVVDCDKRYNGSLPSYVKTICFKMTSIYQWPMAKQWEHYHYYRGCTTVMSNASGRLTCNDTTAHAVGLQFHQKLPFLHECKVCTRNKCNV